MKKRTLTILALAGAAWWILKKNRRASGSNVLDNAEEPLIAPSRDRVGMMTDAPVSLENIRKGIASGWYSAQLCTVDGRPAVKLSGIANGKPYSDYYPVTQATWDALKADGVQQIGRVCGIGRAPRFPFTPDTYTDIYIYRNHRLVKQIARYGIRNIQDALAEAEEEVGRDGFTSIVVALVHGEDYVDSEYTANGKKIY